MRLGLGGLDEVWKDSLLAFEVCEKGVHEDADEVNEGWDVMEGESVDVAKGIKQALAVCQNGLLEGGDVGVSVVVLVDPREESGDFKVEVCLQE